MAPWAGRSKALAVGARAAGGSLIEIPPLGAGRLFGFFFFIGSSRAGSFPCGNFQCLGGFSTMSSDEDDEMLSNGIWHVGDINSTILLTSFHEDILTSSRFDIIRTSNGTLLPMVVDS